MATSDVGFFDPSGGTGTNQFLPGFRGLPRIPGESDAAYQARLAKAQAAYQQANVERKQITDLAGTEEANSRKILGEQGDLQKQRLNDLATLLAQQNNQQFNRDIPGIAETAQGQGFLETSGFGNALSRDYTNLQQDTNNKILSQGLADRDLQIQGLGGIGTNNNNLATSGLQRQFSVTDQARADDLARELGALGVPAPAKGPSGLDKALTYAGPILSGVGAVKAA
jgi:hypothetical protein